MKSNILASAAFLVGTATACSAPQQRVASSEDYIKCSAAFDTYDVTVSDVEDIVYGRRIFDPATIMKEIGARLLLTAEMIERDCALIPDTSDLFKNRVMLLNARVQRMQEYLEQRDSLHVK